MKYRSQWPTLILRSNVRSYWFILPKYDAHTSNSLQDLRQNHWTVKYTILSQKLLLTKFKEYHYKELWFMHSGCRLMLVNICMKFHDTLNGFKVIERTWFCHRTANYKIQRDVTKKIHIQELCFLHSACHLLVLNICMTFYESILNSLKVIERRVGNCY